MAKRASIRVEDGRVKILLKTLSPNVRKAVEKEMRRQSSALTSYVIEHHLTGGTTSTKVAVRSGHLRRTTHPINGRTEGKKLVGGVGFGAKYARTHVGPKGQSVVIRPKTAHKLAIPILYGLTASGVARVASPRDNPNLKLIPRKGKDSLLAEISGGGIKPWFVLKDQVTIKARIHPEEILRKRKNFIMLGFKQAVERASKG